MWGTLCAHAARGLLLCDVRAERVGNQEETGKLLR